MDQSKQDLMHMNTTALAFLGDAVYELFIRDRLILCEPIHADRLHKMKVRYVRAEGQAAAIKTMLDTLSEEELALVKRARNRKITSKPKNADPVTYKWATAFEALVGYLYLAGETERLDEIMEHAYVCGENGGAEQ